MKYSCTNARELQAQSQGLVLPSVLLLPTGRGEEGDQSLEAGS